MPLYIKLLHAALSTELTAITPIVGLLLIVGAVAAVSLADAREARLGHGD